MPSAFPPFRIAGNLYYVGTDDLASYLIVTPKGNILINSDLEANVSMIKASIEKLGFKYSDTKIFCQGILRDKNKKPSLVAAS